MTANTFPASPASTPPSPPAGAQTQLPRPQSRRVVDATTRMLHWLMALSFTGAYLTADGERWRLVHVSLGYTLAGLLVARVLWGQFGPRQARLSMLWRKLQGLPAWLKSLPTVTSPAALQPAWRQGQNLMMALVVVLILGAVVPLTLSGYAVWDEWGGEWLEDVHEFFGNALLMMVLAHIGLIAMMSLLRRKNQALPMLTGRLPGAGPDLAKRNHGLLAALVLASVLGFWGWQWSDAPQNTGADAVQLDNRSNHDND
ncbi:cytochrome b/b6 domain-containing protein [Polaromonas glacialis]|uniref:cytochrome b/b6 domain-containing protein n=1 Tax=Polaromonas glacialis TaxID=866564 RepID=UPI000495848E|nr:cytochrome b/b6 domain-containing protein [Polaromonas glacialis]